MQKRVVLISLVVISLLFIVSCGSKIPSGENPLDTSAALRQVQTGTSGVDISLVPNFPPTTIYDQTELVAIVEIHNRGNYDLSPSQCFIGVSGFDPNIVHGDFASGVKSCSPDLLEGKNIYNLEGTFDQVEFRSSSINLPRGVFEYNPNLNFVNCYSYHTTANPEVCLDPLFYQIASEQKACTPQDVSLGGGQGAPVGVSYVNVNMVGDKAIFEINILNQGNGRVLSPYSNIQTCGLNLQYDDFDRVNYNVELGGRPGDCKPRDGYVRLNNGNGKIVCSFALQGGSAYQAPLLIDLDYNYMNSLQKQVKIISTPQ